MSLKVTKATFKLHMPNNDSKQPECIRVLVGHMEEANGSFTTYPMREPKQKFCPCAYQHEDSEQSGCLPCLL